MSLHEQEHIVEKDEYKVMLPHSTFTVISEKYRELAAPPVRRRFSRKRGQREMLGTIANKFTQDEVVLEEGIIPLHAVELTAGEIADIADSLSSSGHTAPYEEFRTRVKIAARVEDQFPGPHGPVSLKRVRMQKQRGMNKVSGF